MRLLVILIAVVAGGCAHARRAEPPVTTRWAVGDRVTWSGVAENHKVGAFLAGPGIYVDLPEKYWPSEISGKRVKVTGTIVERYDLPVFIPDPDEPPVAGIPVPPGTDLHEAAKRYILENVEWATVADLNGDDGDDRD